jgi:hypothetical protein
MYFTGISLYLRLLTGYFGAEWRQKWRIRKELPFSTAEISEVRVCLGEKPRQDP